MRRTWLPIAVTAAAAAIALGALAGWGLGALGEPLPEFEAAELRSEVATKTVSTGTSVAIGVAGATPLEVTELPDAGELYFDTDVAMSVIKELTDLGPRRAGSEAEAAAFDALQARLEAAGYAVSRQTVPIPGGKTTQNVIAERAGRTDQVLVLGAHVDTKPPSLGGNDNASGCGVLIAMAEAFADLPTDATLRFIFFGAEEISGDTPEEHHFGSRYYVDTLSGAEKSRIAGMLSVDMVGYGPDFHSRTMQKGPQSLSDAVLEYGRKSGYPITFKKDPGRSGWSDHEAFEFAGIPAAWIEWRDDPVYHTAGDTYSHVQRSRVQMTGELLTGFVLSLTEADLAALSD